LSGNACSKSSFPILLLTLQSITNERKASLQTAKTKNDAHSSDNANQNVSKAQHSPTQYYTTSQQQHYTYNLLSQNPGRVIFQKAILITVYNEKYINISCKLEG